MYVVSGFLWVYTLFLVARQFDITEKCFSFANPGKVLRYSDKKSAGWVFYVEEQGKVLWLTDPNTVIDLAVKTA